VKDDSDNQSMAFFAHTHDIMFVQSLFSIRSFRLRTISYNFIFMLYKLTPRFHGIKSSWFNNTALGVTSPLAAFIQ